MWSWQARAKIHITIVYVFFYPSDISHFHSFGCPLGFQFGSLRQNCDPDRRAQNSHKSLLCLLTHLTFSIFIPLAFLRGHNLNPCRKSVILICARKIHIKAVCVFCPSHIFHFHSFGGPLGSQFGSLQRKCDPDLCAQNSHKSRLCVFYPSDIFHVQSFGRPLKSQLVSLQQKCDPDKRVQNSYNNRWCLVTPQAFSILIRLAVPWRPILDPCGKSVILTSAREIHITIVCVFSYPSDIVHFHSFGCPLGLNLDPCSQSVIPTSARKINIKIVYVFLPSDIFHFHSFGCPLTPQLGSLRQKCDPGRSS